MEREWREASDLRASLVSIGIVVISAALLRGWNVRQGPLSPAENDIVGAVVQLFHTGAYRPAALAAPTLPVYLHAAIAIVHFLWGATLGMADDRRVRSGAGRCVGTRGVGAARHRRGLHRVS